MNNAMNKKTSVLIHNKIIGTIVWLSLVVYLIHAPVVIAQQPDNDAIPPPLSNQDSSKTIVVTLDFQNSRVTGHTTDVVFGHAPLRLGNPPLLRIDLFDFRGSLVEQFNAWHPLWTFVTDDTGSEHLVLETEATGAIAFPFFAEYGTMRVVDVEQDREIFSVDLSPIIRHFCEAHLDDPECGNIADFPR